MRMDPDRGVSRRDFVAAAVAIGGSAALSACLERETPAGTVDADFPAGSEPATLPAGQHVWNEYLVHDPTGNTVLPSHQLVLGLAYAGSTPPTDDERAAVAEAMASLDRAFQWGTGGDPAAAINEGLLSMLGYSTRYFDRLGVRVDLPSAGDLLRDVEEDPAKADGFDALLVLNSDFGSVLLAAEEALTGAREELNGVPVEGTFEGVFDVVERRAGVVGRGLPARELERDDVHEEAPLSMGFRSGFADNQATEARVTLEAGPFAGGTTLQASRLHIDLDRWYDQSEASRVHEMFSPTVDPGAIGPTGDRLGSESEVTAEDAEDAEAIGDAHGTLGHTQKVARGRDDDFEPTILRRTEGVATDVASGAGFNFHSIQRDLAAFVAVRRAMNVDEYHADVPRERHGIVDYLQTEARGAYLVPPRADRALPVPRR